MLPVTGDAVAKLMPMMYMLCTVSVCIKTRSWLSV